jgi:hypothetical protein
MDLAAGRKIHHGVGTPERRPTQLLHFLVDRRRHGGVANVGVDLHCEVPPDDHRLQLGMVDVRRDYGAATRNFGSDKLGIQPLTHSHEGHLLGDDAGAR